MKTNTTLDYAFFRLDSTLSRCELWISSNFGTEKLASGSFNPFLAHLKVVQQQIAAGASSVEICPSPSSEEGNVRECQWFSKGTLERFVRFVSTPEVLERPVKLSVELNCLKGIARSIANDSTSECDLLSSDGDITTKQLIEVVESRHRILCQAQDIALLQAQSAGFDMDAMPDLLAFANCFGALRFKDNCLKFMALLEERQDNRFCLNEPDFEAASPSALDMAATEITQEVNYLPDDCGSREAQSLREISYGPHEDASKSQILTASDWLFQSEEPETSMVEICKIFESRQDVECLTTYNADLLVENSEGSCYLQPEMQCYQLTSEQFNQTGHCAHDCLCRKSLNVPVTLMNCCGTVPSGELMATVLDGSEPSMAMDAAWFEKELLSISSNDQLVEEKGRLFDRYRMYREAKLQRESALKKAERRERLKVLREVLEKGEAELISTRICSKKKENLSIQQGSCLHLDIGDQEIMSQKSQGTGNTVDISLRQAQKHPHKTPALLTMHRSPVRQEGWYLQNSGFTATPKLSPTWFRSSNISSPRNSLQSMVSSPRSITKSVDSNISLAEHNRSSIAMAKTKHSSNKKAIACPEGSKKENTKPASPQCGQSPRQGKPTPKAGKLKNGVPKTRRTPGNAVFPLESSSLLSPNALVQTLPAMELRKGKVPAKRGAPTVADSKGMQVSNSPGPLEAKDVQSRLSLQSKAYKVSLSMAVPKHAKPFLRKGHGIGPGAGPGAAKLKESLALDDIKAHNQELLETSDMVMSSSETARLPQAEENVESQSVEDLKQNDCCGSSSVATDDLSAVKGDSLLTSFSFDCRDSSAQPASNNQSGVEHSLQAFMQSDNLPLNCHIPHEASDFVLLPSSPKSTLQTHYLDHEHCAIPAMSSSTCQFEPDCCDRSLFAISSTSENACGISHLHQNFSVEAESPMPGEAFHSQESPHVNGSTSSSHYTQELRQVSKGFKLFLRFRRKKQHSRTRSSEGSSVCIPSGTEAASNRATESGSSLTDTVRIESSPSPAHRSFFSLFAFRSKGPHLRL